MVKERTLATTVPAAAATIVRRIRSTTTKKGENQQRTTTKSARYLHVSRDRERERHGWKGKRVKLKQSGPRTRWAKNHTEAIEEKVLIFGEMYGISLVKTMIAFRELVFDS